MGKTFTAGLKGKAGKPYGVGAKIVTGKVQLEAHFGAVHAKDIGLKTIDTLVIQEQEGGTDAHGTAMPWCIVDSPGDTNNYASISNLNGSVVRYIAVGE